MTRALPAQMMRILRRTAWGLTGIAAAGWLALSLLPELRERFTPDRQTTTGTARVGGTFELTDQYGQPRSDADLRGRVVLLSFGCVRCSDLTRAVLQLMSELLAQLGDQGGGVHAVLISTDPENDSPPRLANDLAALDPRIIGLTGTREQILRVAKLFHVPMTTTTADTGPGEAPPTVALPAIYVLDKNGIFIESLTLDLGLGEMVQRVRSAIAARGWAR